MALASGVCGAGGGGSHRKAKQGLGKGDRPQRLAARGFCHGGLTARKWTPIQVPGGVAEPDRDEILAAARQAVGGQADLSNAEESERPLTPRWLGTPSALRTYGQQCPRLTFLGARTGSRPAGVRTG